MGQNGFGSERVRVKTGQLKKRVVLVRVGTGSGRNGFGSERVRVESGPGQNGFWVGSGRVSFVTKMFFFKERDCTSRGNFVGSKRVRVGSG
ncbi:hypothetical protein Hanom_Chr01g00007841 [Helianthus anomalus]